MMETRISLWIPYCWLRIADLPSQVIHSQMAVPHVWLQPSESAFNPMPGTTDIYYGESEDHVQSGSLSMTSFLKHVGKEGNSPRLLAHIHGHTHQALGLSHQIGGHPTVNPGALKNGRFAHVSFQRQHQGDPWKLRGVHFLAL